MTTETQCTCLDAEQIAAGSRVANPKDPTSHAYYCETQQEAKPDAMTRLEALVRHCDAAHDERNKMHLLISEARAEYATLREQLRLTNDKMAEQVRQARYDVSVEALYRLTPSIGVVRTYLESVRDANTPKD